MPSALSQLTCEMIISLRLPYKNKVNAVIEKMLSSYNVPRIKLKELETISAPLTFITQDMAQICNQNPNIPEKRSFVAARK